MKILWILIKRWKTKIFKWNEAYEFCVIFLAHYMTYVAIIFDDLISHTLSLLFRYCFTTTGDWKFNGKFVGWMGLIKYPPELIQYLYVERISSMNHNTAHNAQAICIKTLYRQELLHVNTHHLYSQNRVQD